MLPGCHLASLFLPGVILLLLFPTHITPPYCFHSNAITEMTVFSCCYHSSLSNVHIWRLSSSQERCSLQQIANCGAGSVGVCAYYVVQVWEQPYYVMHLGTVDKSLQKEVAPYNFAVRNDPVNALCRISGTFVFGCNIFIDTISKDKMEPGLVAFLLSAA